MNKKALVFILSVLIAVLLVVSLPACGTAEKGTNSTEGTPSSTSSEETNSKEESSPTSAIVSSEDSSSEEQSSEETSSESSSAASSSSEAVSSEPVSSAPVSSAPTSSVPVSSAIHTHRYNHITIYEPSCTQGGYSHKVCSCGAEIITDEVPATGHFWSAWKVLEEASVNKTGVKERTCAICNSLEQVSIPMVQVPVEAATWEEEVLRLVNMERARYDLPALAYRHDAQAAADTRAKEVEAQESPITHDRPDGSSCFTALDEIGITYHTAGENIARGQKTPAEVVQDWIESPPHHENILYPDFTHLVVGIYDDSWVQLFLG